MSTYTSIASQTLGSSTASVTFTNIPQTYTDLVIVGSIKTATATNPACYVRFNGDTGSNYSVTNLYGNGSTASSVRFSSQTFIRYNYVTDPNTTNFATMIMNINNYSNTTTYKNALTRFGLASIGLDTTVGLWRNTSAITEVTFTLESSTNFASGSTFNLYGIASGDVTVKATGGDVTTDGTYYYHTFLSSGTFTPLQPLTVDYLVVAGGGSAGCAFGGGGGAGGLRSTVTATGGGGSLESPLSLTAQPYSVLIGAGGAGGSASVTYSGANSTFASITSIGGGRGGTPNQAGYQNGGIGGSGGGGTGAAATRLGGAGTANQGYAGGTGQASSTYGGGGGGGAGGTGANGTNIGGVGGVGVQITALATPTGTGANSGYYAGGGGGGAELQSGTNAGGLGGGGFGTNDYNQAGNGTVNTGGGGGGTGRSGGQTWTPSGAGGSGIVIVRYAV